MNSENSLFLYKFLREGNNFFEINFAINMNDRSERRLYSESEKFLLIATTLFRVVKEWQHSSGNFSFIRWNLILSTYKTELSQYKQWTFTEVLKWFITCICLNGTFHSRKIVFSVYRYLSSTTANFSRLPKPVYKSAKGKSFNEWVCTWTSYMITKVRLWWLKLTTGDLSRIWLY